MRDDPRSEPVEVTATMFDGQRLRVRVPEIVGDDLCAHGQIEPDVTAMLVDQLRPGMTFVDIGAHYGYFALLASRLVAPGGRVVAFEPTRSTVELLRRNVEGAPRVVVEESAVLDRAGTVELHDFGTSNSALNTVLPSARVPESERRALQAAAYEVAAVTLDDYTREHDVSPDVVKIDAEGAESSILRGMRRVLTEDRPIVILETGDYEGMTAPPTSASLDLLDAAGYLPYEFTAGNFEPHQARTSYGYGNLFFLPSHPDARTGDRSGA